MADKQRVYKLTAKQAKKAGRLFKGGKTTKKALQIGLKKGGMPAAGQSISNWLQIKRGKAPKHPYWAMVADARVKYGYTHKEAMRYVNIKPDVRAKREAREAVRGIRGRIKAQKVKVGAFKKAGAKKWAIYYEVGLCPNGSPPCDEADITWTPKIGEVVHYHKDKPTAGNLARYEDKIRARTEKAQLDTRNYRMVQVTGTKTA